MDRGQANWSRFLGHLHEHGRVIGFLIEEILNSRHAELDDLEVCRKALSDLHRLGIKHGDTNKYNFLIQDGHAVLIDFETAEKCHDSEVLKEEMDNLETEP